MLNRLRLEQDRIRKPYLILGGGLALGFLGLLVIWVTSGMDPDSAASASADESEIAVEGIGGDDAERVGDSSRDLQGPVITPTTLPADALNNRDDNQTTTTEALVGKAVITATEPTSTVPPVTTVLNLALPFDEEAITAGVAGLPTSGVAEVWQLDFSCQNEHTTPEGEFFARQPAVRSQADLGFGSQWNFLRVTPNERDSFSNRFATRTGFSATHLLNSEGDKTDISLSTRDSIGCFTQPVQGGATGAQSVTGDYLVIDQVNFANVGPATFDITGLEDGDYQLLFVSASEGGNGRESVISGPGFEETVPFSPDSSTFEGNYATSPRFSANDSISLDIRRGPDQSGLGEFEASVAGLVLVRFVPDSLAS